MLRPTFGRRKRIFCDDEEGYHPGWDVASAIAGSVAMVVAEVAARRWFPELFGRVGAAPDEEASEEAGHDE